jgi:formiminotetrahydrofolate cyclodeaminase
MNEPKNPSAGIGLGIAGLILGLMSIPLGVMGCTFVLALIMGIVGITLSAIGYSQAREAGAPSGLIIAALIISILGTSFALIRMTSVVSKPKEVIESWKNKIEFLDNHSNDIEENFNDSFKEGFEEEFDGNLEETFNQLEKNLNQLEKELESAGEKMGKDFDKLTDEEKAKRLGKATGKALKGFVDELNDSTNED